MSNGQQEVAVVAERTGTRLSREARRDQLVSLGAELVATTSFEALSTDEVAVAAGISRGLLFHYFPSKREFQVAVAEHGAQQLLAATEPPVDALPLDRLRIGVEAFLDHVGGQPAAYLSLVRGAATGDPALRAVAEHTRSVLVERVLDGLGLSAEPDPAVLLVVRGWVAASEEIVVTWLDDAVVDRGTVVTLIVDALLLQLGALLPTDIAARVFAPGEGT